MRIKIALAVAASMVSGLAWATPAMATEAQCLSNRACLFGNNDFDWLISMRTPNAGLMNMSATVNDKMDSWINRTNQSARGYEHADARGACQTFSSNTKEPNVSFWNSDEVSSWATDGKC